MIKVIFKVEVSRRPNERPTPSPKSNCMDRPGSTKLSKYVREKCSFPDYPSFILLGPTKTPHVAFLPFFCQNPSPSCSISRRGWKFRTGSLSIKIGWCPLFNLTLCMSTPPCKRTVHAKDMLNDWCVVLPGISWGLVRLMEIQSSSGFNPRRGLVTPTPSPNPNYSLSF